MPLSKERNRERMRQSRLHKATSVPQGIKPVQPKSTFVFLHKDDWTKTPDLFEGVTPEPPMMMDADGNIIPVGD